MNELVLLSDPRIAAIAEATDPQPGLVDVSTLANVAVDPRKEDPEGDWHRVRIPVAEMLLRAATLAKREGVVLRLVEGYRPLALQRHYFDGYMETLRSERPHADVNLLRAMAARHVSPPEVAPHVAGAAVDVTLEIDGVELDLGCPVNATPEASSGRCYTDATDLGGQPVQERRRQLVEIMSSAGFVNYPTEWWHWSYGDRYWAWATGAERALLGPVRA